MDGLKQKSICVRCGQVEHSSTCPTQKKKQEKRSIFELLPFSDEQVSFLKSGVGINAYVVDAPCFKCPLHKRSDDIAGCVFVPELTDSGDCAKTRSEALRINQRVVELIEKGTCVSKPDTREQAAETETDKQMEKTYSSKKEALDAALAFARECVSDIASVKVSIKTGSICCEWSDDDCFMSKEFKYHELQAGYVYAVRDYDSENYEYCVFNGDYLNDGTPKFSVRSDGKAPDTWAQYKPTGIKAE